MLSQTVGPNSPQEILEAIFLAEEYLPCPPHLWLRNCDVINVRALRLFAFVRDYESYFEKSLS
jgi:hypothetical protein